MLWTWIRNVVRPPTLVGLLLRSLLPLVLLSLCALAISYQFAKDQIHKSVLGQIEPLADQIAAQVRAYHEARVIDLESIVQLQTLTDIFVYRDLDLDEETDVYLRDFSEYISVLAQPPSESKPSERRYSEYRLIAFYGLDGKPLSDASGKNVSEWVHPAWRRNDFKSAEAYAQIAATGGESGFVTTPIEEHILDQKVAKTITLTRTYHDREDHPQGTIVLVFDTTELENILSKNSADRTISLYDKTSGIKLGLMPRAGAELSASVDVLNYRVTVEANEEKYLGPLANLRNITILVSLLLALLVCVVLIRKVRISTRPIHELVEGTKKLAAGDFDYKFPLPKLQDLKELAVAFNDMTENVKVRSDALQDRVNQLQALRMMEQTVLQGLDEEQILRTTLRAVSRGLGFDRAGLYWVDESAGIVVGRYSYFNFDSDFTEEDFRTRSVELGGTDILNRVITNRRAQLITDPDHTEGVDPNYVKAAGTREFVMAPLCGQDHVYGVITADNCHTHRPLSVNDRDGLTLFASAAGMALENARLVSRVAASEARHRMVLENSPVAILALSRDHRILTWNHGAEVIFGHGAAEVVGKPIKSLIHPDAALDFEKLLAELLRSGSVHEFPIAAHNQNGDPLDITISWGGKNPDFMSNDEWAVVIRDVTESRKLQGQLVKSEKLSAVGQLISGIAHELNNPLQAVIGYAQLLAGTPGVHQSPEIKRLNDSAQRCRRIIDNLLLFVRHGDVKKSPVNLRQIADASFELLAHKLRQCRVEHTLTGPRDGPWVMANFQQIEQVFINLISNACDAMRDRSAPHRIDVRVESAHGRAQIHFHDNGPGVPSHARESIFEPFFTTKGAGQGTGLGLHLCRQILQEHGGNLLLLPDGPGARFAFDLQLCDAPRAEKPLEPAESANTSAGKIFVVDDEPEVRALLQDVLEAQGHEVVIADSIAVAAEILAEQPFDLMISDIHLNDGNGMELCSRWDRITTHPKPRILFLTGDIINSGIECVSTGCESRILQKPMDLREFRAAVAWGLEPRHAGTATASA